MLAITSRNSYRYTVKTDETVSSARSSDEERGQFLHSHHSSPRFDHTVQPNLIQLYVQGESTGDRGKILVRSSTALFNSSTYLLKERGK
jgi:hypothetical protein